MRPEKKAITEEIRKQLEASGFVLFTDYHGLSVELMRDLRTRLSGKGASLHVVKNSFLVLAANEVGWDSISSFMKGPTAMIVGDGDIVQISKLLREFTRQNSIPVIKGGILGETPLSVEDINEIAAIPGREVLTGIFAGTVAAPLFRLVGAMGQKLLSLLYVLKAVEKSKQL